MIALVDHMISTLVGLVTIILIVIQIRLTKSYNSQQLGKLGIIHAQFNSRFDEALEAREDLGRRKEVDRSRIATEVLPKAEEGPT